MNKIENSKEFNEIVFNLNNKNFQQALNITTQISKKHPNEKIITRLFASIYFGLRDWANAIKYFEKTLSFEKIKFKIYTNIGVALFNLGKINQSIDAFKKSIKDNPNSNISHNNIGVSYLELGMFEQAINHFVLSLKLNENYFEAQKNLLNTLNFAKSKNKNQYPLIRIDYEINKIKKNYKLINLHKEENIKIILENSNKLISSYKKKLFINETQIFRKNSTNLNCNRHFKIFNKFNTIPKYCFSCYKIQLSLNTIVDLIKLFFIFDGLNLINNNIRKCMVEIRDQIKGNYKGYIYCEGLSEAKKIIKNMEQILIKSNLNNVKMSIKHGCSEFYQSHPNFEKINYDGEQEIKYNENWENNEKLIDMQEPIRAEIDRKKFGEHLRGINLSDILIINNWINYAAIIGDYSYKNIYDKEIKKSFINDILEKQIKFRKKNLII